MFRGCIITKMSKSTNRLYRDPYSPEEIETLVEEYEELNDLRSKSWIQVRLIDLDRAFVRLPRVYKEAILLCGFVGLTTRSAGKVLGISHEAVRKRYIRGLDNLARLLNGGT